MVSALSRKELNQIIIEQLRPYGDWTKKSTEKSKAVRDNFPYALQEFINSHMDLPTLEEIAGKQNKSAYSLNMAR
jgi:hypothetical protein